MTSRSRTVQKHIDELTTGLYGQPQSEAGDACIRCSATVRPEAFRDELSLKEFGISHLCQDCQDAIFGRGDEDDGSGDDEEFADDDCRGGNA